MDRIERAVRTCMRLSNPSQKFVETAGVIERMQIVVSADMRFADEDLRDGTAAGSLR